MKKYLALLAATLFFTSTVALAGPFASTGSPTIIGYEILNANPSGTGGWEHSYDGEIIDLGADLSGNPIREYYGGTGTLADGIIGNSVFDSQLFRVDSSASITLFFDDYYFLDRVSIFGGPESNEIPGGIETATFSVWPDELSEEFSFTQTGIPFGALSARSISPIGINDEFLLSGSNSLFSLIPVDMLTISNIQTDGIGVWSGSYSITEIQVSAVPEPSTYALMLGGLGLVGFMATRRRKQIK